MNIPAPAPPPPAETAAQAVLRWARAMPDGIAASEAGQRHSWAQLARDIAQYAHALPALGLAPGMLAGLHCESRYRRLVLVLACEVVGATHLSLLPPELAARPEFLDRCDFLLAEAPFLAGPGRRLGLTPGLAAEIAAIPVGAGEIAVLGAPRPPGQGVRVGRTSGTTGTPKYMLNTAAMLESMLAGFARVFPRIGPAQRHLCLYDLTLRGVYVDALHALRHGTRIDFTGLDALAGAAGPLGEAHTMLLPRDAAALARRRAAQGSGLGLRYIDITGAALTPGLRDALQRWVSRDVRSTYSSNEASIIAVPDASGALLVQPDVELRLVDAAHRRVPQGRTGEVMLRSPRLVDGYLWDAELTARHFRAGWLLTGDLARQDAAGRLHLLGRSDDMLNIGGVKIPPGPIEQLLGAVPGIAEAVLLDIADATGIGALHVVACPADRTADPAALAAAIAAAMPPEAGTYTLHIRTDLPRTATGKPRRAALRQLLGG